MTSIISNAIVIILLVLILGAAISYIYREKKKGTRCIGCPSSGTCPKHGRCSK